MRSIPRRFFSRRLIPSLGLFLAFSSLLLTPANIFLYTHAFAQATGTVSGLAEPSTLISGIKNLFDALIDDTTFITGVKSVVLATIGGIITGIGGWFRTRKYKEATAKYETQVNELSRRLSGVRFGLPEKLVESYNRVLLVGLSGTGKTTLIRKLLSNKSANPRVTTADLFTYSLVHETIYRSDTSDLSVSYVCRMDIDDYRGQYLSQILNEWKDDFRPVGTFACSSVIFIADLFEPLNNPDAVTPHRDKWSAARVRENLAQWSESLVRAIIEKADSGNLKYVCLFVNKMDLLRRFDSEIEKQVEYQYRRMRASILKSLAGVEFDLIVGSAEKGIGVSRLLNRLVEVSAPPGPG
jgi:GTPase SAR1 family protein